MQIRLPSIILAATFCHCWVAIGQSVVKAMLDEKTVEQLPLLEAKDAKAYGLGFARDGEEFVCDNGEDAKARRGIMWSIELNQEEATPVLATALARSESVPGLMNADYSLYLDLAYNDGTTLWGQSAFFNTSPELGWQRQQVLVTPAKPIKRVSCYLLFRNRAGRVRFKDARLGAFTDLKGALFDGAIVSQSATPARGFLLRDAAANSGFVAIDGEALGVRLKVERSSPPADAGVTFYDVTLESRNGGDRALTLVYTMPQPRGALTWFHDPRDSVTLEGRWDEVANTARMGIGSNGEISRYPFGAVAAGNRGCAVGLDPATPLFYRIGCQAHTRELYLACDIGLAPEKNTAHFRFCVFDFNARDGFRGALSRYYGIFPESFVTRINRQGVWMPFARISKVEGWQDFGFRFKEGDNETAWDDANDILTFRYTEPMTWWMPLEADAPRTLEYAREEAGRRAEAGDKRAQAWLSSAFEDESGEAPGRIKDTPWCNGVVWSMNSAPGVPGEVTDFKGKWNPDYLERQYGASRKAVCDGEYIDSAECYVTEPLNFRRDHFAGAERPLCYALNSCRVGIYKGMSCFEYVRALEREMRERGHHMMANATPINWFWLAPLLDVMGTEINWKRGGKWSPMSDANLLYRRALCKGKPYCFLMNTDFTEFGYTDTERFMRRSLAYGFFPGFFSANASTGHYFQQPALYNRDRPLFRKYVPLCRLVAEAGWEPLTRAATDNKDVIVERFGETDGTFYLTLYNLAETRRTARLTLTDPEAPHKCRELVEERDVEWRAEGVEFTLESGEVRVLALETPANEP